ncbi:C-3 sterol dehydrogenase [Lactarius quietus]|nr:C-3 sterol dehydrogenase [Lactarius quietus]
MPSQRDSFFVIGGSGFLGRHIVQALVARGDPVAVFDIVQRYHDTPFYSGDISDQAQVSDALRKSGATCIIHTASPPHDHQDPALYWKVNENKVSKLVYTSSAAVVFNGQDLINVDERIPFPDKPLDAYNESKAQGEQLVIAANGVDGLLTVALRPAGFWVVLGFAKVFKEGRSHFQIGDNTNLFDWTYVGNVAHAHILAADKLVSRPPSTPEEVAKAFETALPPIDLTTGQHRVPTSSARPLGPYVERPARGDEIASAFEGPHTAERPAIRSRFDQLSDPALKRVDADPLQVAGQVFFITNGEPVYFWDFPRRLWRRLNPESYPSRDIFALPKTVGLALATLSEWFGWLSGREPTFTRFRVTFSCVHRWYNIERARRVLGYEPQVGLEEAIRRTAEWWKANESS